MGVAYGGRSWAGDDRGGSVGWEVAGMAASSGGGQRSAAGYEDECEGVGAMGGTRLGMDSSTEEGHV